MDNQLKDKLQAIIVGHALGDALGAPSEFFPFAKYTGKLEHPIVRFTRAYGRQSGAVGQITDDTEMAIALLRTISIGYTKQNAIMEYMSWANNLPGPNESTDLKGNCPFMGKNTRNLFVINKGSKPTEQLYNNRFNKVFPTENSKQDSQSNGVLMRAYPLAFVNDPDILTTDVELTNPSSVAKNATEVYVAAIRMAINNTPKTEIMENLKKMITEPSLLIAYNQACNNEFRNVTINRGHLVHSFYCAFWGLFNFSDYKSAIDAIICLGPSPDLPAKIAVPGNWKKSEVIVSDTDTNAAIAGALLGAYYGYKNMLNNSINKENIDVLLNCNPNKADIKRPVRYILNTENFELLVNRVCTNVYVE